MPYYNYTTNRSVPDNESRRSACAVAQRTDIGGALVYRFLEEPFLRVDSTLRLENDRRSHLCRVKYALNSEA